MGKGTHKKHIKKLLDKKKERENGEHTFSYEAAVHRKLQKHWHSSSSSIKRAFSFPTSIGAFLQNKN